MNRLKQPARWVWKSAIASVVLVAGFLWWLPLGESAIEDDAIFEIRRGDLEITLTENGEVEATEAQEIRSRVRGRTAIIDIIEEGYRVTAEDVENGLVLVELDSSDLEERLTQREIAYQNSRASLSEAEEQYAITLSQNESNIHDAELALKFAAMDLERFLGDQLGDQVLAQVEAEEDWEHFAAAGNPSANPSGMAEAAMTGPDVSIDVFDAGDPQLDGLFDYDRLIADERLGGEARQALHDLDAAITLTEEELTQAETQYEWTVELAGEGFVTPDEQERDRLSVQRRAISRDAAQTDRELFVNFEFPKQLEELASDYVQARRRLDRAKRQAAAETAQAQARLRSRQATYELQARRKEELIEQIEACVIRAEREGVVIYASVRRGQDPIEEGTEVRERQEILSIPDMNHLAIEVNVHESFVNRLRTGLPARIRSETQAGQTLRGEVTWVALVPDSGHRWRNPDLRIFPTTIEINGSYEWLRPGMTAEVEVVLNSMEDVIYAPLESVVSHESSHYVYVLEGNNAELRPVEIGAYNDSYVHIRDGLDEGDQVLRRPPYSAGVEFGAAERIDTA